MRFVGLVPLAMLVSCRFDATLAREHADAAPLRLDTGALTCAPTMANLGSYCIDMHEVTLSEYQTWLGEHPATDGQPDECSWNTSYALGGDGLAHECDPATHPEINKDPSLPVVCIDWCDARAYCVSRGGHLCGNVDGSSEGDLATPSNTLNDPDKSEWYRACVGPDRLQYPYGSAYVAGECNDFVATPPILPLAAGSRPLCHGKGGTPYGAIYDLSGNVAEWTNSCQAYNASFGAGDKNVCTLRGGWWTDSRSITAPDKYSCEVRALGELHQPRAHFDNHIGFRCCKS